MEERGFRRAALRSKATAGRLPNAASDLAVSRSAPGQWVCGIFQIMGDPGSSNGNDKFLAVAFLLLLILATPFTAVWANGSAAWYLPYLLWLGLILVLTLLMRRGSR